MSIIVNGVEKQYKDLTDKDITDIVTEEQESGKFKTVTEIVCRGEDLRFHRQRDKEKFEYE
jgi:hypothetical protein